SLGDDHYLASGTPPATLPHDYYVRAADGFRYKDGGGFGDPKYPSNSRPDAYLRHRNGYNVLQLDGSGTWHSGLVDDADGDYDIDSDDIFRYLRKFHARKVVRKDMEANAWVPPWEVDTGSGELP
ncbi:MAG: hypothetical protein OER86_13115, partial [Phycisphaerae bacterium]|nr:hypothetical protein [Phycisphaerae bacterium]